jgi:hypothetical protein
MEKLPYIIFVSGRIGSGKDTVANVLVDEYGFKKLAFADVLKQSAARTYSIPLELMYSQEGKNTFWEPAGRTVREILQTHADAIKTFDPEYFARVIKCQIQQDPSQSFVVSDWRFPNEFEGISNDTTVDAHCIRIRIRRDLIPPTDLHISETALEGYPVDYELLNFRTLEHLKSNVEDMMAMVEYRRDLFLKSQ